MRTHRFDLISFLFGAVFVAIALIALLDSIVLRVDDWRWIGPGLLVALGIALLVSAGGRGRQASVDEAPVSPPVPDTTPAQLPDAEPGTRSEPIEVADSWVGSEPADPLSATLVDDADPDRAPDPDPDHGPTEERHGT